PFAYIVLVDDEIITIVGFATHEDMNIGCVCVPVVDRDPVEPRTKIGLHIGQQLAGERRDISQLARIFRRDDEAEVMPVIGAAFGKCIAVRWPFVASEKLGVAPVTADTLAL